MSKLRRLQGQSFSANWSFGVQNATEQRHSWNVTLLCFLGLENLLEIVDLLSPILCFILCITIPKAIISLDFILHDVLPDGCHQVVHVLNIVLGGERNGDGFVGLKEVPEVGPIVRTGSGVI